MNEVVVIFDGQCELCKNAVTWVSKKLVIDAVDFHTGELSQYSLNKEQCAREVFVICGNERWSGAGAVVFLLKARGNKVAAGFISVLGPISRFGYRWVASNRSSWPVKILSRLLA